MKQLILNQYSRPIQDYGKIQKIAKQSIIDVTAKKHYFKSLATGDNMKFRKTVKLQNHVQVSTPVLCAAGVSALTDREKANTILLE